MKRPPPRSPTSPYRTLFRSPYAEPTRVAVEDRREGARPVHARQRKPLDVPARRDERAHLAVGQERVVANRWKWTSAERSEEHTSELQSRQYLVCRLLLVKKK